MKSIKKVAWLLALSMTLLNGMPSIFASEKVMTSQGEYGFKVSPPLYTSTNSAISTPDVRVYQENRSDGVYLCVSVSEANATVYVNNSNVGVYQQDLYRFYYRVNQNGWYSVNVRGQNGSYVYKEIYITGSNNYDTSLSLSKDYRNNGEVYLVIKARDDDGIRNVTVNDSSISFNEYSGEVSYRVYSSKTYTVKVTDRNGNVKTDSLYINVDKDTISLSLSKTNRSNKWYLVIKADSDTSISSVTVDGRSIAFPSAGGTQEYEVTKSGTYRVVVKDKYGYYRSDSLYIDIGENTNIKPDVKVTQNYKVNNNAGWYLLIAATDDGSIASVTVNGESIPYDAAKQRAEYYVPVDGTYTIVVTDNDGNSVTKSTFAAGNAGINQNTSTLENGVNQNTQATKVVFKLNSKAWSKDGNAQQLMNVAPKMVGSRIYLPIRYVAYALGIDASKITWNAKERTVSINSGYETIRLKVGSKEMYVNNQLVKMEAVAIENGGRVMLPISQIKSAFSGQNIQLDWNNNTKELTVTR